MVFPSNDPHFEEGNLTTNLQSYSPRGDAIEDRQGTVLLEVWSVIDFSSTKDRLDSFPK